MYPGRLGTLPTFESQFAHPIAQGGFANATKAQVRMAYRCAVVLRDLLRPYLLRRMKADVRAQLPTKTERILFCRLSAEQRRAYIAYLDSEEMEAVLERKGTGTLAFRAITTLRKVRPPRARGRAGRGLTRTHARACGRGRADLQPP